MAAKYRKVSTSIWKDAKVRKLSERGKFVLIYLLTHPNMTSFGAVDGNIPGLAFELQWPASRFRKAVRELSNAGMIKIDDECGLIWFPKFFKHNPPENPNVIKSWAGGFNDLTECAVRDKILLALQETSRSISDQFLKKFEEFFAEFLDDYEERTGQEVGRAPAPDAKADAAESAEIKGIREESRREGYEQALRDLSQGADSAPAPNQKLSGSLSRNSEKASGIQEQEQEHEQEQEQTLKDAPPAPEGELSVSVVEESVNISAPDSMKDCARTEPGALEVSLVKEPQFVPVEQVAPSDCKRKKKEPGQKWDSAHDQEFMQLREVYSRDVRAEGPGIGFVQYQMLKKQNLWPGLGRILEDIAMRKSTWTPEYAPGLVKYLSGRIWDTPNVQPSGGRRKENSLAERNTATAERVIAQILAENDNEDKDNE